MSRALCATTSAWPSTSARSEGIGAHGRVQQGDSVVAIKNIGGMLRPSIDKGAKGTITEVSFFGGRPTKVVFHTESL